MAIAIDKLSLGTNVGNLVTLGSTTLTTAAAAVSGSFIVASVMNFGGVATLVSVSGGGLSWNVDVSTAGQTGNGRIAVASAQAPAGLASSTVITFTWSAVDPGVYEAIGATSFTGVKTTSPLDGTPTDSGVSASSAWTTGNVPISPGSVLIGFSNNDTDDGSVVTAPSIEAYEIAIDGGGAGFTSAYRIEPSAGSYSVAGTWNSIGSSRTVSVAYLAAPATQAQVMVARHAMGAGRW